MTNTKQKKYITIKIEKTTYKKLKDLKIHPNQSYSEVIEKLIKVCGDEIND